ncbi:hypothetical protein SETIT_4G246700v2 [Setaria italica]|uniref:ABC transporter domain-containing protein n=1 Tax=Setaria italica TaxID=4555 RepID=A0A368QY87_SETIT|nr:hypothetical protein SETIT_4G246700v2 [Setaria italica]
MRSSTGDLQEHLLDVDGPADGAGAAHPKIRVRGLRRLADATGDEILRGVDLDVPRGVVMGVIGPSGSGKSTLLRALNRLWEPAPGAVLLDGADIRGIDVLALRRRVGMLFQLPAMFDGQELEARSATVNHLGLILRNEANGQITVRSPNFIFSNSNRGGQRALRAAAARQEAHGSRSEESAEHGRSGPCSVLQAGLRAVRRPGAARRLGPDPRQRPRGAAAGRADERAGPHLHAEHRGGDRAAEEGEGAHHGARLPQREADPAHRRPGVPRRLRRDRRGARAVRAVRRQAPHGQALLGAQQLMARPSSPFAPSKRKEYM